MATRADGPLPGPPRVTLRDVALRAGVSPRTVSNVVNDFPYVAEPTRVRVREALAELGYQPNMVARSLRRGRTGLIALVLPELDVPYFAELTRLVVDEARRHGFTVMVDQTNGDVAVERELVRRNARGELFDGMIFSPLALRAEDLAAGPAGAPIVLLGEHANPGPYDHIVIDNVRAARMATEHLITIGRRRIAAIGDQPYPGGETAQYRTQGYQQALRHAGLPYDERLMAPAGSFHRGDGATAMRKLLRAPTRPDAVFCYNDLLAFGAMRAILERGLRIPHDIAIAGFDDTEEGRYTTPTLTTVSPAKKQIAELAVRTLLRRIEGDTTPARTVTARHRLRVRESTAP
jgi:LacI family repressor for deo operon, udp, cdd, tsx, nupC, and nupG